MILKRAAAALLACLLGAGSAVAADDVLNISYVKSPFNLQSIVMKKQGLLEKELEPLGVSVVWHEIDSGAQQAQAMAAGSLDVGGVMNTTSIQMARGEGNPIKIVAGVSRPTGVFAIVAAKNGVGDIKSLKGKIVAGPKGTVLHQILVAALAREGMSIDDVQFIQMDIPKAFAALESGRADAALLAANTVVKAQEAGGRILATGWSFPCWRLPPRNPSSRNIPTDWKLCCAPTTKPPNGSRPIMMRPLPWVRKNRAWISPRRKSCLNGRTSPSVSMRAIWTT